MKGWYKQLRNRCERSWFKNAKANQLYDYLKDVAYVNDSQYRGVVVRRGSCPTTRAEMMEATGQTYAEIRTSLKLLQDYGEIIVKASNKFTIITICDYDALPTSDDLFSAYDVQPRSNQGLTKVQLESNQSLTTPIYNKRNTEDKNINNNLRSHYIPSKTERDNAKSLIYEIKEIYNSTFKGVLREWQRLSDKMAAKVETCIMRFGRQSIDMVFDQIKHEQTNLNKNGFVPDFDFIFSINQYETYLERYKLRIKKKAAVEPPQQKKQEPVGLIDAHLIPEDERRKDRKLVVTGMVKFHEDNPGETFVLGSLIKIYESGEMAQLGIDWKPSQKQ